jgi:prepilin-type N-terminal cleavage/methylation domain-containing protein
MRRGGFTLIEVMIALVVSSVVVLLAYATLRAGVDVEQRVTRAHESAVTMVSLRTLLADALRHATMADPSDPGALRSPVDGQGRMSRLVFTTRGITAPLGGSPAWQVQLTADGEGVLLQATPTAVGQTPLSVRAAGPVALGIRFLGADDRGWRRAWEDPTRLPVAFEVRFLTASGADHAPPLIARTQPVSGT